MPDHPIDQSLGVVNAHCPLVPQVDLSDTTADRPPCAGGPPIGGGSTVFMQCVDALPLQNGYVSGGGGGMGHGADGLNVQPGHVA
jgi:hypothetical protein